MAGLKLFVGNLPYSTSEPELREVFERTGSSVTSVRIIHDRERGRSKGYGFVEMATPEDADRALRALQDAKIAGLPIVVTEARSKGGPSPGRR